MDLVLPDSFVSGASSRRSRGPSHKSWTFLQLADSAFPVGGFAHSSGLEAGWQHGAISTSDELKLFLRANLWQVAQSVAPFIVATFAEPDRAVEFDALCDTWTTNHVANRASCVQGKGLLQAVRKIFELDLPAVPQSHYGPSFGLVSNRLGFSIGEALELFFFIHLRGLVSSAVRLGIVGPTEGQRLQHRLSPELNALVAHARTLSVDDLAQTAPLIELWQGAQDRLYSRLFQS